MSQTVANERFEPANPSGPLARDTTDWLSSPSLPGILLSNSVQPPQ